MRLLQATIQKWNRLCVALIVISLISEVNAQTVKSLSPIRPFARHFQYTATGQDSIFYIDTNIVVIDTVYIQDDTTVYGEEHFSFDASDGKVILSDAPRFGSIVNIHGYISPFSAGKTYFKRKVALLGEDTVSIGRNETNLPASLPPESGTDSPFYKSGSLTRAFTFGTNRGLELESGLNMQVRGNLGSEYKLRAVLTDQNIPLQPEGNTRTLNEIDKVYIDIAGPGLSSRFGDIYYENIGSQFGQFNRKLTGITFNNQVKNNDVSVSIATAEGQYHSIRLQGIEGNQGPYLLSGKNGERFIIVLAGTEKVYVDGNMMTRGEDYDYVVDYASAQITFTRNRLITGDSRIVVDFQYSDGNYKKSFYSIGLRNTSHASGFTYSASFTRESDNKDKPQSGVYSGNELSNISNAGDNPFQSNMSGVEYVGTGRGTYEKVVSEDVEYFEYTDSGDYKVRFSDVGEGNGEYVFQRLGVYNYVGDKSGRFSPIVLLPLPSSHSITDIAVGYQSDESPFRFNAEYAISSLDKNVLSNRDDNDNGGNAFAIEFALAPSQLAVQGRKFGFASLKAKMRQTDAQFNPIDRTTRVEFDRKWDLEQETVSGENIFELEGEYKPVSFFSIRPSIGAFKQNNGFQSRRQAAHLLLYRDEDSKIDYQIENISSNKSGLRQEWVRQKGVMSYQLKGFTPSFIYENESKRNNQEIRHGFTFTDWAGKLQYRLSNKIVAYGMFQVREDKLYEDGILQPLSRAENRIFHAEVRKGQRLFSRIHIVNRNRKYYAQRNNVRTNLADIKTQSSEFKGALITRIDFQLSSEKIPQKELVYLPVEDGHGKYSFDKRSGEYFPDPNGKYELRTFTTDKLNGVERKKIGITVNFDPSRFLGPQNTSNALRFIRSATIVRFENSKQETDGQSVFASGRPVFKFITFSQDVFLFERNNSFNLRLRHNYRKTDNNQVVARNESRESVNNSIRLRSLITEQTSIESNISFDRMKKHSLRNVRSNHSITTLRGDVTITARPDMHWMFFLKALGARQRDTVSEYSNVTFFTVNPGFERGYLGSGRLSGNVQLIKVNSRQGNYLPYEFADGNQPGNNYTWTLSFNHRTTKNFITSIMYSGNRKTRYDRTFHNLRAELQVLF